VFTCRVRCQLANFFGVLSGFFHQEIDGTSEIEIGYRLHPNYWNKGLATEAAQAVRDHAFRDLNLSRLISLIHPENAASRRVAEKIGLQLERKTVFEGLPPRFCDQPRTVARESCRLRNSSAKAR
jgi:RimJ/RimL family protein N-acetyltransferase